MAFPVPLPSVSWYVLAIPFGVGLLFVAVVVYMKVRKRVDVETEDIYALVVDPKTQQVQLKGYSRMAHGVYVSRDGDFLVVSPRARIYTFRSGTAVRRVVLAYNYGLASVPVDLDAVAAVHIAEQAGLLSKITSPEDLLVRLYSMASKTKDTVEIKYPTKVAISIDFPRVVVSLLENTVGSASASLAHFINTASNLKTLEEYMKVMARYRAAKYSWLQYIAVIIIAVGVAIFMIKFLAGGG